MSLLANFSRRQFVKATSLLAASVALPAAAQRGFPHGPLRIVVGLPPGGSADVLARAVGVQLEASLKQPVIVDNRPGGLFKISMNALVSAPADGHTLLYIYNGYPAVQVIEKVFNLQQETVPIMQVATTPIVLMVRADSPFKTLGDFIAHARAHPGKLNYSTLGPAGLEHLKMAQIFQAAGVQCVPVPYRGGPDIMNALLGGEVQLSINASIFAKTFASADKVRVLAVLGEKRWSDFPDVPTIREAGVAVQPIEYWGGLVARAGTPPEIIQRLQKEVSTALRAAKLIERFEATAHRATPGSSAEAFRDVLESDVRWMTAAAKEFSPKN
jgi:tripartite-type tricarboxylate transporter receptor subunit TctC